MKNALVVDDTKNIRKLLSTCLELKGYKVFEAANGSEALKLIQEEAFDLRVWLLNKLIKNKSRGFFPA